MRCDYVSMAPAEQIMGLPTSLLRALVDCGEVPSQPGGNELYIGKAALLGWCRLYGQILRAVEARQPRRQVGSSLSARSLVWMSQAGLLAGKDRVRP
jgi:hypothetical protein